MYKTCTSAWGFEYTLSKSSGRCFLLWGCPVISEKCQSSGQVLLLGPRSERIMWVQTAPNLNTPALLCKHFQPLNVHSYNTANRVFNPLLELQQLWLKPFSTWMLVIQPLVTQNPLKYAFPGCTRPFITLYARVLGHEFCLSDVIMM